MIVLVRLAEPLSDGQQAARLWGQVALLRVSAADNERQVRHGGIARGEPVLVHDCVEAAVVAAMTELDIWDIKGRGAFAFRDGHHLVARRIQKLGLRIDEALDQPRAGDAIHLRSGTGYPLHQLTSVDVNCNMGYTSRQ